MIPDLPNLSDPTVVAPLFPPYDRDKSALRDYARGGIALLDASKGLNVQNWVCELNEDSGDCFIWAQGQEPMKVESFVEQPDWISMAFDQNMHYNLAYTVKSGHGFLYWYDAPAQRYNTSSLGVVRSPIIRMDDFRKGSIGANDIILSYIRGSNLYCRVQRDRYEIEYLLAEDAGNIITRCGLNKKLRFQWNLI